MNPVGEVPKVAVAEAMLRVDKVGAALEVGLGSRAEKLLKRWRQLVCRYLMQELDTPQQVVGCVACKQSKNTQQLFQDSSAI